MTDHSHRRTDQENRNNRPGRNSPPEKTAPGEMPGDIYLKTERLTAGYRGIPFIHDISISLSKGRIMTLIGPNGSGKSTILKTLSGRIPSLGGSIFLKGRPRSSFSRQELARTVAVMSTDPVNTELMKAREIVEAGRYPYTGSLGILSESDHRAVEEAIRAAHVEDLADLDFMALSDGQRQRILLARAIAQEAEFMLLDEPTSFLDIRYQLELLEILGELCSRKGTTILMSLHELFLVEKIADTVVCLKNGRIQQIGPVGEIFSGRVIDDLYDLPAGTYASLREKK